ncbi:MAG: hypothetical protein HY253_12685 [Burkholderiales bacterium]|nr:hypothetical protein [Burkholderiales bacterium]
MKSAIIILALFSHLPIAEATEITCPSKVDLTGLYTNPPAGWHAYKRQGSSKQQSKGKLGLFKSVAPHDGSPVEGLGDLIPDNDDSGKKQGFWIWSLRGITSKYAGCEYSGTNVILIKKIEGENISSCRVPAIGEKQNQLSCY